MFKIKFKLLSFGVLSLWLLSQTCAVANTVTAAQWQLPLQANNTNTTLSSYKGKVIWLDFWASWCTPCRASFPWLNKMQQRYGKKGLQIIGVNVDQDTADAKQFLQQLPAKFKVCFDPKGSAPLAFDIRGMPTSVLIDRKGNIHLFHIGFKPTDEAEMEALINKVLNESSAREI